MNNQYTLEDSEDAIQLNSAWHRVVARIQSEVQENVMQRFITPLRPISMENNTVRLAAPGRFIQEWVRDRFSGTIQSYLSDELGTSISLEILAAPREKSETLDPIRLTPTRTFTAATPTFQPNPKYTFENFVQGQSNRLGFAGAQAVATQQTGQFNPLFIYGSPGLGKTHLLHAIAHQLRLNDPSIQIAYLTAQQFAEEFINALQTNKVEQFRRQHRNVGIWLVDDIQFIAGKDKTQEEIFHNFNYLQSLGKQIVLTSDRPPKDLYMMDERLRSRFEGGLVADIQTPDTETRCAIVLAKAKAMGIILPFEIGMLLAEGITNNIRSLEGALTKLVTLASLANQPITTEFTIDMMDQYYKVAIQKPGFNQIVDMVSKHYNINIEEIRGSSRKAPIVHARHVAIFLTRRITGDSWKHIGSLLGDRDHTSIMHGYQKINEMMHYDKELMDQVKSFIKTLHPGG
jgi:chromosomal replication initiator protein